MEKMRRMERRNRGDNAEEKNMKSGEGVIFMLKCLLISYVLTAGLLLLLALMLYRFGLKENIVNICIIAIYIIVTFLAGMMVGKRVQSRRFLWGLLIGVLYFVVLAGVSFVVNRSIQEVANNFVTVFLLCAGSGMLGGMVS